MTVAAEVQHLEDVVHSLTHEFIRPMLGDMYQAGMITDQQWHAKLLRLEFVVPEKLEWFDEDGEPW